MLTYGVPVDWSIEPLSRRHVGPLARLYAEEFFAGLPAPLGLAVGWLTVWERARKQCGVVAVVDGVPAGVVLWERSKLRPALPGLVLGLCVLSGLVLGALAVGSGSLGYWLSLGVVVGCLALTIAASGWRLVTGVVLAARSSAPPSGSWTLAGFVIDRRYRRARTGERVMADELVAATTEALAAANVSCVRLSVGHDRAADLYRSFSAVDVAAVRWAGRTHRVMQVG